MSMGRLKAIQIGVGGFGASWLKIIENYDDIELLAVVDTDLDNLDHAKTLIKSLTVQYFTNHLDAFSKVKADIAIIITPPQTHKRLALDALEHNLNVFIEKPIAHTLNDAIDLLERSKAYS